MLRAGRVGRLDVGFGGAVVGMFESFPDGSGFVLKLFPQGGYEGFSLTHPWPWASHLILPAGTRAASQAHVCRTTARRAERAVVALGQAEPLKDTPRQYLNRLSDLMFVLARVLNRMHGGDDVYWKSERMARAAAE